MELWKPVKDYENFYMISNYGNIKNVKTNKKLKAAIDKDGYFRVHLSKNGKGKMKYIHRLVAEAFIPNLNNDIHVNHKDENKQNNNVDNLEWCSVKYNCYYSKAKKIIQYDKNFKLVKKWNAICDVENDLGICNSNITRCCKGRSKTAGGYIWRYNDG